MCLDSIHCTWTFLNHNLPHIIMHNYINRLNDIFRPQRILHKNIALKYEISKFRFFYGIMIKFGICTTSYCTRFVNHPKKKKYTITSTVIIYSFRIKCISGLQNTEIFHTVIRRNKTKPHSSPVNFVTIFHLHEQASLGTKRKQKNHEFINSF